MENDNANARNTSPSGIVTVTGVSDLGHPDNGSSSSGTDAPVQTSTQLPTSIPTQEQTGGSTTPQIDEADHSMADAPSHAPTGGPSLTKILGVLPGSQMPISARSHSPTPSNADLEATPDVDEEDLQRRNAFVGGWEDAPDFDAAGRRAESAAAFSELEDDDMEGAEGGEDGSEYDPTETVEKPVKRRRPTNKGGQAQSVEGGEEEVVDDTGPIPFKVPDANVLKDSFILRRKDKQQPAQGSNELLEQQEGLFVSVENAEDNNALFGEEGEVIDKNHLLRRQARREHAGGYDHGRPRTQTAKERELGAQQRMTDEIQEEDSAGHTTRELLEAQIDADLNEDLFMQDAPAEDDDPNAWMNEVEESDDDAVQESFEEAKRIYRTKKKAGEVSVKDRIDWLKARKAEQQRILKQNRHLYNSDSEGEIDDEDLVDDPDARNLLREAQAEHSISKANAKAAGKAKVPVVADKPKRKRGGAKGKKSSDAAPNPKKQKRVPNSKQKATNPNFYYGSLFGHDTLGAANLNSHKAAQPGFTASRKDEALAQLLASIPEEHRKDAEVKHDQKRLLKASKDFHGHGAVKSDQNGNWRLKKMASSLKHHQLLGAAWMRNKENQMTEPRGGILADDMGIGKTVMTIANIVDGMRKDPHAGATLIVMPSSLLRQWKREILKHTEKGFIHDIIVFKKSDRSGVIDPENQLGRRQIILTSYHELRDECPKYAPPDTLCTEEQKQNWWAEHFEENKGPLFRLTWNRIVFDECQACKNAGSQTAIAAKSLDATHRWLLSGTPLVNRVNEFYSYFQMLQMSTGDLSLFERNYQHTDEGSLRLEVVLASIMMRRVHGSELFQRPIVQLPKNEQSTVVKNFTPFERAVYNIVHKRCMHHLLKISKHGEMHHRYSMIFTMLLRLRQLSSHVALIQETIEDLLEKEDIEELLQVIREEEESGEARDTLQDIHANLSKKLESPKDAEGFHVLEIDDDGEHRPAQPREPQIGGEFGNLSVTFKEQLEELRKKRKWEDIQEISACSICELLPNKPYITDCGCIYCFECITSLEVDEYGRNIQREGCKRCSSVFKTCEPVVNVPMLKRMSESSTPDHTPDRMPNPVAKKKISKRRTWLRDVKLYPSTKFMAVKAQIARWQEKAPDEKIIIFSQFRDVLLLLGRMCDGEGWESLEYHGGLTLARRDGVLEKFRDSPSINILLTSLKAGGTGLNLVMANKIINMEPWWNLSVEQQAYCRVFRLGQNKETEIVRLIMKDSVEEEILRLQHEKCKEINQVMNPATKLTMDEMLRLFGQDGEDGGHIWPDTTSYTNPPKNKRTKPVRMETESTVSATPL